MWRCYRSGRTGGRTNKQPTSKYRAIQLLICEALSYATNTTLVQQINVTFDENWLQKLITSFTDLCTFPTNLIFFPARLVSRSMAGSLGVEEVSSPEPRSSQRLTARMARVPPASRFFSSFSSFTNDMEVIVGENDISDTEQMKVEVAEVVIHPMYRDSSYNNDFSILRLHSPLPFSSSIRPVCLPSDVTATFTGEVICFL